MKTSLIFRIVENIILKANTNLYLEESQPAVLFFGCQAQKQFTKSKSENIYI